MFVFLCPVSCFPLFLFYHLLFHFQVFFSLNFVTLIIFNYIFFNYYLEYILRIMYHNWYHISWYHISWQYILDLYFSPVKYRNAFSIYFTESIFVLLVYFINSVMHVCDYWFIQPCLLQNMGKKAEICVADIFISGTNTWH